MRLRTNGVDAGLLGAVGQESIQTRVAAQRDGWGFDRGGLGAHACAWLQVCVTL